MIEAISQFDEGKLDIYKRDFQKTGNFWDYDYEKMGVNRPSYPSKMEYLDPTEIIETKTEMIVNVPLTGFSMESLKIVPHKAYIIIQSVNKTIFVSLGKTIMPTSITASIKKSILIITAQRAWK